MIPARIGWATPWNINSAIAQSASEVGFELARRGHDVTVLRTEVEACRDLPARRHRATSGFLADCSDASLQGFDVLVGHMGNHYGFHGALLPRLGSLSMVGILHDACIAHLMRGWLNDDPDHLRAIVRSIYEGTLAAEQPFDGTISPMLCEPIR